MGMYARLMRDNGYNFYGSDQYSEMLLLQPFIDENSEYKIKTSFEVIEHLPSLPIFLKTKIKNWESRPDLEGRAQAHAPTNSYSIGLNYIPFNNAYLNVNLTGKSGFYYSDSHNNKSDSYLLTNVNFGYELIDWTFEIWARNLFDEYYATRGFYFGNEAPDFVDTLYERHGDPRHLGLSVRYDF